MELHRGHTEYKIEKGIWLAENSRIQEKSNSVPQCKPSVTQWLK